MDGGGEDTQGYMDQSILAIFEDTAVPSEVHKAHLFCKLHIGDLWEKRTVCLHD